MFNIFEDNEINNNIFNSPLFQNNEDVEKDSSICLSYINSLVNEEKKEEFDNSCFNEQKNENLNYIINRFQFANSNKTIHDKAKIIENNTDKIIPKKSTNISSIDNPSNITMFNAKKFLKIKRIDYSIKHFKAYFSKFLRNYGNKLIKKSELEISLKKKKLYLPNYNSFTGNPKEQDNYDFLSFSVRKIFSYVKESEQKNYYQNKNAQYIKEILDYIKLSENSLKFCTILEFFNMSIEKAYEMFYESTNFMNIY